MNLGGFAQGLARSPLGNLPQLLIQKEQLANYREDREKKKVYESELAGLLDNGELENALTLATRHGDTTRLPEIKNLLNTKQQQTLGEILTTGGVAPARAEAIRMGRFDFVDALDARQHQRKLRPLAIDQAGANVEATKTATGIARNTDARAGELHKPAVVDARLQNEANKLKVASAFAKTLVDTVGKDWSVGTVDSVGTRLIRENSLSVQSLLGLPSHRQPVAMDIVTPEDGEPRVGFLLYNERTGGGRGSVGPWTWNGTDRKDDNVVSMPLSEFRRRMESLAGGTKNALAMKKAEAELLKARKGLFKATADGDVIFNTGTGESFERVKVSSEISAELTKTIDEHMSTGAALEIDSDLGRRTRGILEVVAWTAQREGYGMVDSKGLIGAALAELGSESAIRTMLMSKDADTRDAGMQRLMQRLGLIEPEPAGLPPAAVAAPARARGDTHPGAAMPRAPDAAATALPPIDITGP